MDWRRRRNNERTGNTDFATQRQTWKQRVHSDSRCESDNNNYYCCVKQRLSSALLAFAMSVISCRSSSLATVFEIELRERGGLLVCLEVRPLDHDRKATTSRRNFSSIFCGTTRPLWFVHSGRNYLPHRPGVWKKKKKNGKWKFASRE